jgi:CxxC-x17-CxxC domain-containing protein
LSGDPDRYSSTQKAESVGISIMSQIQATSASNGKWSHSEMEFEDQTIKCVDCGDDFIWTAGEQVFFHDKGLKNEPKRCKPCKQAKNERLAAIAAAQASGIRQRIEVSVQCAQCGQQTTVPFYPSQGRPVYCRSCFLAGRAPENESH